MTKALTITIIGQGKVGHSFHHLLSQQDHTVAFVGRSLKAQREHVANADLVIITVDDGSIRIACEGIADALRPATIVAHCSGALSSQELESAQQQQCHIASMHPLNTFPNLASSLKTFDNTDHNTHLYIEGDQVALDLINPLSEQIGFVPVKIASSAKAAYHAACVFACNYLTTLMDLSLKTAEEAGLDTQQFWCAIQPMIQSTLSNIGEKGTASALSGPIARGDHVTIARHIATLSETKTTYQQLGLATLKLAAERGELNYQQLKDMEQLLK